MNQGRIWCVVNPTVGLPLFIGSTVAFGLSRPEFGADFGDFLHEMAAMQKAAP